MRRTPLPFAFALLLTIGTIASLPAGEHTSFVIPVAGQGPVPLPEPINNTTVPGAPLPTAPEAPDDPYRAGYFANIIMVARAAQPYVEIEQGKSTFLTVDVIDYSLPGAEATYGAVIPVNCEPVNTTETDNKWSLIQASSAKVLRNQQARALLQVTASPFTTPEYFTADISCRAGGPLDDKEVGRFNVTARVLPYTFLTLTPVDAPPVAGPDEIIDYRLKLKNNGNHAKMFYGNVEIPEGWHVTLPEQVVVRPGEERELTLRIWTPREKSLYLSESQLIQVSYYPEGEPGKARFYPIAVQVNGIYVHPALVPLTLLTALLVGALVFFAILARRAVEERILGKPVPPWRIPVEREHLQELMRDNPDQYYIVRYYLMVEEHQSALLWFEAFKAATKKDRKRETRWYNVKAKQERKVVRLEKAHNRFVAKWDKDTDKPVRMADRKKRRLERKLRRKERKQQRRVNRKHKKRSKKVVTKHEKKVKKVTERFEKKRDKELRKVEKANRKREKNGEEPMPVPDLEPPTFEEPVAGEPEIVAEAPLMESRYAKRAERLDARAERQKERLEAKRLRAIAKDRRRVDVKSAKLRSKIPPEPETALYSHDEYVPEDQVVVEDDRSSLAKWLFLPTLEERDQARRRRQIHRSALQQAKQAGDEATVERLSQAYAGERKARVEERKHHLRGAAGQRKENRRLAAEHKRQLKARTRRIKAEEDPPQPRSEVETLPRPVRSRPPGTAERAEKGARVKGFKLGKRNPRASSKDAEASEESPQATSDDS